MGTSWRTTLGGSLSALGKMLLGVVMLTTQFPAYEIPHTVTVWTIVLGFFLTCFGSFFAGLFARDIKESDEQAAAGVVPQKTGLLNQFSDKPNKFQ